MAWDGSSEPMISDPLLLCFDDQAIDESLQVAIRNTLPLKPTKPAANLPHKPVLPWSTSCHSIAAFVVGAGACAATGIANSKPAIVRNTFVRPDMFSLLGNVPIIIPCVGPLMWRKGRAMPRDTGNPVAMWKLSARDKSKGRVDHRRPAGHSVGAAHCDDHVGAVVHLGRPFSKTTWRRRSGFARRPVRRSAIHSALFFRVYADPLADKSDPEILCRLEHQSAVAKPRSFATIAML
jgi:hypothetical protein